MVRLSTHPSSTANPTQVPIAPPRAALHHASRDDRGALHGGRHPRTAGDGAARPRALVGAHSADELVRRVRVRAGGDAVDAGSGGARADGAARGDRRGPRRPRPAAVHAGQPGVLSGGHGVAGGRGREGPAARGVRAGAEDELDGVAAGAGG